MKETSGPKRGIALASFDPDTSTLKTSQTSLLMSTSGAYYPRLPQWGMIVNGALYPLTMLELPISEKGGGLWLGTPRATEARRSSRFRKGRLPSPEEFVELWRTPAAQTGGKGNTLNLLKNKNGNPSKPGERAYNPTSGNHYQITLDRQVEMIERGLWPTPQSFDAKATDKWQPGSEYDRNQPIHTLSKAVKKWPTPRKEMAHGYCKSRIENPELAKKECRSEDQVGGPLNPDWVEWLMGWPIGWTDLKPSAMDKFQEWLRLHGRY